MSLTTPPGTVAYLTKRFPRLSETFILDEILGLEHAGVPLRLYAIADPGEATVQPDVSLVSSTVTYLRHHGVPGRLGDVIATLGAHAELSATSPRRYAMALREALDNSDRRTALRHLRHAGLLAVSLRRAQAVHLHAAFAHTPASIARYTHLLTGIPFSFAAHAKDLYRSDPVNLAVRAVEARFVLVCSQSAADALAERAGPAARIIMLHHGVDTHRFTPSYAPAPDTGELKILAVGRLVAKKGYPVLLDALAQLRADGRRFSCEIVGDGDLAGELTTSIERLGLRDAVTLLGACTHQEVAARYGAADVFAQTSVVLPDGDRDGIPNSLLEAMASGLPVVASRVAGIPEVVTDRVTGLLVDPGASGQLADALQRLGDPALRRSLGDEARRQVVSNLDRRVCARRVAELFADRPTVSGPAVALSR